MIKKHLITCSVIFVLFIISKLFIFSVPEKKPLKNSGAISEFFAGKKAEEGKEPAPSYLNFANENLPLHNARVKSKIKHSIQKRKLANAQSAEIQQRAKMWFPVIVPILKSYGIPEDFKYIPLLESGFENKAVSPKGAAGMWQFMPQTAREYGLRVGRGTDERLNVRKSTIAACKYLKELYGEFNSWTLAAAAYNAGSPRVQHAINRKNKGNYFYMRLNRETGMYVYRLIAIKEVMDGPDQVQPHIGDNNAIWAMLKPAEVLALN